jgi:hypothetical protein
MNGGEARCEPINGCRVQRYHVPIGLDQPQLLGKCRVIRLKVVEPLYHRGRLS